MIDSRAVRVLLIGLLLVAGFAPLSAVATAAMLRGTEKK